MNLDLTGKHALVCGGSQGIGRAAAMEMAALGADITILSRTRADLEITVAALPRTHSLQMHSFIEVDIANSDLLRTEATALGQRSAVHILVNNTGGPPGGPAHTADACAYLDAFQKHLIANHVLAQSVLPAMKQNAYGRIINVISTSVKEPIKNLGVSNTIRGAVASWAKTLATELGPFGITVNNVLPGYTKTQRLEQILSDRATAANTDEDSVAREMITNVPLRRFAEASEIANAIAFLASPAASYITGINIPVDGGRTLSL